MKKKKNNNNKKIEIKNKRIQIYTDFKSLIYS